MSDRPDFDDSEDDWLPRADVLRGLFSGRLSTQAAAEELAKVTLSVDDDPETDTHTRVEITWTVILVAARTFPEQQETLVDLLLHMSRLPPAKDEHGEQLRLCCGGIWEDLPEIGMEFNHEWNALDVPQEPAAREKVIEYFLNANKFCARLKLAGHPTFEGFDLFGLWTMRSALEDRSTLYDDDPNDPPDVFIPAAAAWIAIAGSQMYQWDKEFEYGGNRGQPGRGGPLWNGRQGFAKRRFHLWRRRFGELAQSGVLSDELRTTARRAEMRMDEIETEAGD